MLIGDQGEQLFPIEKDAVEVGTELAGMDQGEAEIELVAVKHRQHHRQGHLVEMDRNLRVAVVKARDEAGRVDARDRQGSDLDMAAQQPRELAQLLAGGLDLSRGRVGRGPSSSAPASVSSTSRVVRRSSSRPSSASSRLICWETAGCATDSARLARVNCP